MDNKSQIIVDLPTLHPSVTLPRHLAKVLQLVIEADFMGINTIQLYAAGCSSPSNAICKLRDAGALIETQLQDATDAEGNLHKRIAHYFYYGWQLDDYKPTNTIFGGASI